MANDAHKMDNKSTLKKRTNLALEEKLFFFRGVQAGLCQRRYTFSSELFCLLVQQEADLGIVFSWLENCSFLKSMWNTQE